MANSLLNYNYPVWYNNEIRGTFSYNKYYTVYFNEDCHDLMYGQKNLKYNCDNESFKIKYDLVKNFSKAFYGCTNIIGNAVRTVNAIDMNQSYFGCNNLNGSPYCSPVTEYFDSTYSECKKLSGSPVCGDNVVTMQSAYYNCVSLTGVPVIGDMVQIASKAYANCTNLTGIALCPKNVLYLDGTFSSCSKLDSANINANLISMQQGFSSCSNLKKVNFTELSPLPITMRHGFMNCHNLIHVNCDGDLSSAKDAGKAYFDDTKLSYSPREMSGIEDAYEAKHGSDQIDIIFNGEEDDDVIPVADRDKPILLKHDAFCEIDNCNILYDGVSYSPTKQTGSLSDGSLYVYYTVPGKFNLVYDVWSRSGGYSDSGNITILSEYDINHSVSLEYDINYHRQGYDSTYYNCYSYSMNPYCPPLVTEMNYTYYNCSNLRGVADCGNNVINMNSTYYNCYNLSGVSACGPNVLTMKGTYKYCSKASVVMDDATHYHYQYISGITNAYCGDSVQEMPEAFFSVKGLHNNFCIGNNVYNIRGTFEECYDIYGSVNCWYNDTTNVDLLSAFGGRDTSNRLSIYVKHGKKYDDALYNHCSGADFGNIIYSEGVYAWKEFTTPIHVGETFTITEYNQKGYVVEEGGATTMYYFKVIPDSGTITYTDGDNGVYHSTIDGNLKYYCSPPSSLTWTDMTNGYQNTYWNIYVYNNLGVIGTNAGGAPNLPWTEVHQYTGQRITPTWHWFEGSEGKYTVSGETSGTAIGRYNVKITLTDPGYEWESTSASHNVSWYISPDQSDLVGYGLVGSMHVREEYI